MPNNYFIKQNYKINSQIETLEESSGKVFWNKRNIELSFRAQYYVYQSALRIAQKNGIKEVLDIGCGIGAGLNYFFAKDFQIYGVDQKSGIDLCKEKMKKGVFTVDNIESPQYPLKQFIKSSPLIICADVIEHMGDPDRLLQYIKTFSNTDTLVVLSTPDRDKMGKEHNHSPINPYHVREWNQKEFHDYLSSCGFEILSHKNIYSVHLRFDIETLGLILGCFTHGGLGYIKHTQVVTCRIKNN